MCDKTERERERERERESAGFVRRWLVLAVRKVKENDLAIAQAAKNN